MKALRTTLAGWVVTILCFGGDAHGAVVRHLSLEEHLALSVSVVRGTVSAIDHTLEEGMPYTLTTLQVLESYKGSRNPGDTIRIRQLGGPADGGVLTVTGDANFRLGEEVIVFLHEDGPEGSYLTALAFSKYTVDRSAGGVVVFRELDGLSFQLPQGGKRSDIGDTPVALPLFRDALRALQD